MNNNGDDDDDILQYCEYSRVRILGISFLRLRSQFRKPKPDFLL